MAPSFRSDRARPTPAELVDAHWDQAFRVGWLISRDAGAAEEIAQEAMLKAVRSLDRFDPRRPLEPWVNRIVANAARDWRRAASREPELVGLESAPVPEQADIADELAESQLPIELDRGLAALPAEQRAAIVMRHLLDLTTAEITEIEGVDPATVRTRIHRGLNAMREMLNDEEVGDAQQAR